MRKRQLPIALLVATACPVVSSAMADSVWHGSYAVDGQCFCSGDFPNSIASRIVPTPVGGQTVKQICAQVGQGPGLNKQNGLFDHTVYKDPQCGNGPFVNIGAPRDAECVGSLDGKYSSCESAGPRWQLAAAYASPGAPAAANPGPNTSASEADELDAESLAADAPNTSEDPTLAKAVVDKDNNELKEISVMLGDDRFFQARTGMPAQGGAPGTRIILDGLVYLKDDGTLKPEDLYQEPAVPDIAEANPVSTVLIVADESVNQPPVDDKQSAAAKALSKAENANQLLELKKQQELRATRARAQVEVEQQARVARLAEEQKIVKKQKSAEQIAAVQQKELATQRVLAEQKALAEERALAEQNADTKRQMLAEQEAEAARQVQAKKEAYRQANELAQKEAAAEKKVLAEQKQLAARQAIAAREQRNKRPTSSQESDAQSVVEATNAVKPAPRDSSAGKESSVLTALRLPAQTRASSRNFAYFEALPTSYDIGGNGLMLEGSAQTFTRFQFVGRLGVTDSFREFMVGGGYYVTPAAATRMTLVLLAGVESGSFELTDEVREPGRIVTSTDSGYYLGAMSRFVVNNKFELKGGVGYSSFFEGDATLIGGGYYHITPRLDVMSRFELGDNDSLGIGIRYYY